MIFPAGGAFQKGPYEEIFLGERWYTFCSADYDLMTEGSQAEIFEGDPVGA